MMALWLFFYIEKDDGKYLGYERWRLPAAPKVKKPRSIYNAASLAYLGDCIYEVGITFYFAGCLCIITHFTSFFV